MRVSHDVTDVTDVFDDPNLVSCAGRVPVLQRAERVGLHLLVGEYVRLGKPGGVNADLEVASLVAGMVAGADSIDDMTRLRHGVMKRLFTGIRAPATSGTFLYSFTLGHVRQLDSVAATMLAQLATRTPLLAGAGQFAYVDDVHAATPGVACRCEGSSTSPSSSGHLIGRSAVGQIGPTAAR